MATFLRKLRLLVLDEAATQRRNTEQVWAKPVPARVAEGRAVEGLRIVGIQPNGHIDLACERNSSRFREGDILCLNRGDPFALPQVMVTLESDDELHLTISVEQPGLNWGELERQPAGWILDEGYLDLSQYVLDALDETADRAVGRERILPLLMGLARPILDTTRAERALAWADLQGLNWSQSEALAYAYATDSGYLVQGPPGTGKTRVLAHLAQLLVEDGERVLVTAFTHRAINNALNKLQKVSSKIPVAKIGQATRADDLLTENYEDFTSSPFADMSCGYVIGATPFATRTRRLSGVEFETVIFDEASQITLPLAIMGMLAGKKYIFVGDQKQLPPVLSTHHSESLGSSVFAWLAGRGFDTMLTQTYRLNAELAEWPSRQFYDGALQPAEAAAKRRLSLPRPPTRLAYILNPADPKVFLDLRHRNTTTRSQAEASAVVDLITALLECGFPPAEIGVVAPYRAQGREIRNLLRKAVPDATVRRQIITDTVERMQGQERDLVIVSLTTSNPAFAAGLAEFFFQPERLNVAITRPRMKLIVVGSQHVLNAQPAEPELRASVELLRDLLASCTYHTL